MRHWVVQIRIKSRREFPETFYLEATTQQARELEEWIRAIFHAGVIKDFLFEPVKPSSYNTVSGFLSVIDKRS